MDEWDPVADSRGLFVHEGTSEWDVGCDRTCREGDGSDVDDREHGRRRQRQAAWRWGTTLLRRTRWAVPKPLCGVGFEQSLSQSRGQQFDFTVDIWPHPYAFPD